MMTKFCKYFFRLLFGFVRVKQTDQHMNVDEQQQVCTQKASLGFLCKLKDFFEALRANFDEYTVCKGVKCVSDCKIRSIEIR